MDDIILDSEIVPSHYLFAAKRVSDGKRIRLWGNNPEDMDRLGALLRNPNLRWIGFNSNNFDMPLAFAAAAGMSVPELKAMANDIIANRKPQWMVLRDYALEWPEGLQTVDLIEVAPGVMVSLKLYDARMGSPNLLDMPFHHDDWLTDEQAEQLADYCDNDLDATERLFNKLKGQLALRENMSARYGINLMSKSDAQMAETIIAKELGLLRAGKPSIPRTVTYKAPHFVQPQGAILRDILHRVERHTFVVHQSNGAVELPEFLANEPVIIGNGLFQMGVGGLHSKHDKSVHYVAGPDFVIVDADVGAFYPNILLNAGYVPRGLGAAFINVYRGFVEMRIDAKHRAKKLEKLEKEVGKLNPDEIALLKELKVLDAGGKIMINGTFGKLGSCFSKIYAPDLMLGITLTGQFYLLTLIEHLVKIGVTIISANTDGVTFGGRPELVKEAMDFIDTYGWVTNFEFEYAHYRSISMKDCNNYLAVKTDGSVKAKGIYADAGLQKNPTNEVCSLAARAYLSEGTPIREFITRHLCMENFADFLQARTVNGGAVEFGRMVDADDWVQVSPGEWQNGQGKWVKRKSRPAPYPVGVDPTPLGRVARWYYSTDPKCEHGLRYRTNGNLVPKSAGGRACMRLPNSLPNDIDLERYIAEAISHLHDMGVYDPK